MKEIIDDLLLKKRLNMNNLFFLYKDINDKGKSIVTLILL